MAKLLTLLRAGVGHMAIAAPGRHLSLSDRHGVRPRRSADAPCAGNHETVSRHSRIHLPGGSG
jgi:hypothetical protein